MPSHRPKRVAEMIHRELAERLRELKDPELEPISVTRVEVSGDLGRAEAWFLPFGGGDTSEGLLEALGRAAKRLRGPIGRSLRLRNAPELVFKEDVHHEEAVRITRILDQLTKEREEREAAEAPTDAPDESPETP